MSSKKEIFCNLERPIEIYENERLWIGRGFSKAGLLPTERGPYSTRDGSLSWKTMPQACLALLRGGDGITITGGRGNTLGKGRETDNGNTSARMRLVRRGWSFHEEDGGGQLDNNIDADSAKENWRKEDEYECSASDDGNGGDNNEPGGNYCGFVACKGPEDGPIDQDGWQYFPDFTSQSLSSPNYRRYFAIIFRLIFVSALVVEHC